MREAFTPPPRVDPFLKGTCCTGMQTESHKSCLSCKMAEIHLDVFILIKANGANTYV